MSETVLSIKSVFDSKGVEQAKSSFNALSAVTKTIGKASDKASGGIKNFASSLKRIAKLRLLRGIIRSITSAIKEGTENLYRYSQAMNNADAARFSNTMDSLASSLLYMKNAIGSVVAPLMTSLLPAIQTIINAFVTAVNVVAQFFAALGGQVLYTRAKQSATTWKAVETATGGAAAAAKEYKNTILSFDEIHALNDVGGGGGGGGGGASTPDYTDMFEEARISGKIRDLAKWLKENFKDILEIVIAIGTVMWGWKIASGVLDFAKGIGLISKDVLPYWKELAIGLILVVTGVIISAKAGYDIGYEGPSLMNIIKAALGIGLAAAGGALAAHAITSLGIASVGAGVGAVFGVAIALVATLASVAIGANNKYKDDLKADLEDYKGQLDYLHNWHNDYLTQKYDIMSEYFATLGKISAAENIIDQLEYFQSRTEYTSGEIKTIKTLIEQLNNLGLDGITAAWDEDTQQIIMNSEEIRTNIQLLKDRALQGARENILTAAYQRQGEALINMNVAQGLVDKAQQKYNDKLSQYQYLADAMGITLEELGEEHWFQSIYLADETYQLGQANIALDEAKGNYAEATGYVNDASTAMDEFTFETKEAGSSATETAREVQNAANNMNTSYGKTETSAKKVGNVADWLLEEIKKLAMLNPGSNLSKWFNDMYWSSYNFFDNLGRIKSKIDQMRYESYQPITYTVTTVSQTLGNNGRAYYYAGGGFVQRFDYGGVKDISSADIFLANENGNAELVGRIGNRTAVANQQQMVDVLTAGVVSAVSAMQGGQTSNIEINMNVDSERLARVVDKGNRGLNRRYNVGLA